MKLISLLEQDGITARKVAGTHGGEWASACPMCGGEDRFRSWPEQGESGAWWCRGCNKGGDLIQYMREVRGLSFGDACRRLGIEQERSMLPDWEGRRRSEGWKPREARMPLFGQWQQKTQVLIGWAQEQLWDNTGKEVLDWLKAERGFSGETIKAFHLGWIPSDLYRERKAWGLPEERRDDGKPKRLWIPRGLVIPHLEDGDIVKIKIRRPDPNADPRYYVLPGSGTKAMAIHSDAKGVAVLESELDAILLHQEAGDLAAAVALGSASAKPDRETAELLIQAEQILVALDADEAGAKEAWRWWTRSMQGSRRWPPIGGKDLGDMQKAGVNIRAWVLAALNAPQQEMPAVAESLAPHPEELKPPVALERTNSAEALFGLYQKIGETYRYADWQRMVTVPGWKDKLRALEEAFTHAWNEGGKLPAGI